MKNNKGLLMGMAAIALSFGLMFASCGGDDSDDSGGLPGITEETTGQATITGKDIALSGDGVPASLAEQTDYNGAKFSITGGKFSFTLPAAPSYLYSFSTSGLDSYLFEDTDGDLAPTVSSADAKFTLVSYFSWNSGSNYYSISRQSLDTDDATYMNRNQILYVYADTDVTLSRSAKTWKEDSSKSIQARASSGSYTYNWGAVNLILKKGWNLVQIDSNTTVTGESIKKSATVKIADKDVPWTFSDK
ncbi:MAG: hypothetical protein LBG73_04710 [Spirochaetaceae bacterium]|jgi:hypothetical protein|nr:hypothetical protein [Spirochaetaceae bacterium]